MCITFGLTHNGKDSKGRIKWDGCANVKLRTFETTTQFNDYILSFNTNTNHWCAEYIYKRLKFLGSKMYSQLMTLLFLALWHGFHSGYYHCFFMEFLVLYFERDVSIIAARIESFPTFFFFIATRSFNPHFPFAFSLLDWTSIKEQRESANAAENAMGSAHARVDLPEALHFRFHGLRPRIVRTSLVSAV